MANTAHETTGGWDTAPGGREAWGLYFTYEVNCTPAVCAYSTYSATNPDLAPYKPVEGQGYYGRGPMQLSYNYNYGPFSEYYFNDVNVLLANPDRVVEDSEVAWASAIWFWMKPQYNKPSAHFMMTGNPGIMGLGAGFGSTLASSNAEEQRLYEDGIQDGRQFGMGSTINIINGGLECNQPTNGKVEDRIGFYNAIGQSFGLSNAQLDDNGNMPKYCDQMNSY